MAANLPIVDFPYIKISFADGTGLTWKGKAPDYFTSLTHQRIVNGANRLTINITYAPDIGDDPNAIEKAIVAAKGECYVQYGNASGVTRNYKAQIYNYNVAVDTGKLNYTLSAISKAVSFNWAHIKTRTLTKRDEVISYMEHIVTNYCIWNGELSYTFAYDDDDFDIPKNGINVKADVGPVKALQSIASSLIYDGGLAKSMAKLTTPGHLPSLRTFESLQNNAAQKTGGNPGRYFYAIEVDDAHTGPGVVRLRRIDSQQTDASFSFEWGTKNSDILDWAPDYQGQVAIYRARGETVPDTDSLINETTGEINTVKTTVPSDPTTTWASSPLATVDQKIKDDQWWTEHGNYPYRGTLTVLGQPKALSPGKSVIQVTPLLQGKAHHSAGKYKVLKIVDQVNSSGFTTTYTGYKMKASDLIYGNVRDDTTYIYMNGALVPITEADFYDAEE